LIASSALFLRAIYARTLHSERSRDLNRLIHCILVSASVLAAAAVLFTFRAEAQDAQGRKYEETHVQLTVQRLGSTLIQSIIEDDHLYLPVFDVFQFLRIKSENSVSADSISGFFLHEDVPYLIDFDNGRIRLGFNEYVLMATNVVKYEGRNFLRSDVLATVFGLKCSFDFRNLAVDVTSDFALPVVMELRREWIRQGLNRVAQDTVIDVRIPRVPKEFGPAMLDWSFGTSYSGSGRRNDNISVTAGSEVAYGDLKLQFQNSTYDPAGRNGIEVNWRYVDNEDPWLKQASVGNMSVATLNRETSKLLGFTVSNTPSVYRRAFGTYTWTD
jgi:hypothetical protein